MKNSNQVAFITGASSGIGAALAKKFYKEGFCVAMAARRTDKLTALAKSIDPTGKKALVVSCDVTDRKSVEKAISKTKEQFGKINVVIANAGFGVIGKFEALNADDYRRQFDTNVFGVMNTLWPALESLKETKGQIGIVGSVMGHVSLAGASAYAMSKFSVRALAYSLRDELRPYGIGVTLISPGFVQSEIRQVDNDGKWHQNAKEDIPRKLCVPADRAAAEIYSGLKRRKREAIITGHGKAIVFLDRHFPWVLPLVSNTMLKPREKNLPRKRHN